MPDLPSSPVVPRLPPVVQPVRALVWVLHLALPMAGLWLLLAQPSIDIAWHDSYSHFWLVLGVAAINMALGVRMNLAAKSHADARLFLVSLAFLASAGFLLLHALATPGVLINHANVGFDVSQPVGLAVASVFALVSSLRLDGRLAELVNRWQLALQLGLAALIGAWAAVSLLDLPPLNQAPGPREVDGPLTVVAIIAVALYLIAALRYFLLHRRTPAIMLISLVTAFVLLAQAMVAVMLAHKWQLSWWEWHLLLALAFGFVAYSAYVQYRREGSSAGLFDAITLEQTAQAIRAEYGAALEQVVAVLQQRERDGELDGPPLAGRLTERFGLTEGQAAVLDRAAVALASERRLTERLGALVQVGNRSRVGLGEQELFAEVIGQVSPAYGEIRIALIGEHGLVLDGDRLEPGALAAGPLERAGRLVYPITVKGRIAGALEVPATPGDRALLDMLANQLSITLENSRLYSELGTLFRQYLSPDVAAALLADPGQAALGGSVVEVTALFADLRGFTTFSEGVEPAEIVTMLNRYHGVAVPCILDNGGTVVQFVGDALLALFNAPARQPDHALRAIRAGLAMQAAVDEIAADRPDWPRFRVGANTGPALVGNIGSEALHGFNAMGDAVNVAARLQTLAEPGEVIVGEDTWRAAGPSVTAEPLGELAVKGRIQTVRAFRVTGVDQP